MVETISSNPMPPAISFRSATRDDLHAIVAMLADDALGNAREVVSDPLDPAYSDAFDAISTDPNQRLIVAERASESPAPARVVGCLQLTFIPGLSHRGRWRGLIEGVRVASGERGVGIGRAMIEHAVSLCRDRGCGLVQLTSNKARTDARRFYESLGFVASHDGFKLAI